MTTEQTKTTELTLPQRAAVALGTAEHEKQLVLLVEESRSIVEIKNLDARTQCHAQYMRLKNARVSIERAAKDARDDATKFSKAVIAEEKRLIAITEAEESRLQAIRDKWDADREAERQAKIEAERARIAGIREQIEYVRALPLHAIGKSAAEISAMIGRLASTPDFDSFQEFAEEYRAVRLEVLDQLAKAETAQRNADIDAEARRREDIRIKAEREELAKLRAENEARRAEDERKAAEERARQEQELATQRAELARQQAEAQARLDAERAELDRKLAEIEAAKQAEEARRLAQIQAEETEQERIRLQAIADQALADAREPETVVTILDNDEPAVTYPALTAERAGLAPAAWPFPVKARPTDDAIIACIAETFNVPDLTAVDWLRAMDLDTLRVKVLGLQQEQAAA